jgi:hypothetical protein
MRFHSSVVEKLIRLCSNYSGHTNNDKLRHEIASLDLSTYSRESGEVILVESEELRKHAKR